MSAHSDYPLHRALEMLNDTPSALDEIDRLRAVLQPDRLKVVVCEYLLSVDSEDRDHPIIPPTAIDWLGNGIVKAILACTSTSDGAGT